ncbi:hypothetical protein E2C01_084166 [Portunus trituberculatus]|uniref:Uncharacterized protein n=1 Tax=Portunus trituberculatus TaxID=210409 RepID=A0A5B7J3J6_PORTR|nr:hypothetical protein [Portunus trituberculatus]
MAQAREGKSYRNRDMGRGGTAAEGIDMMETATRTEKRGGAERLDVRNSRGTECAAVKTSRRKEQRQHMNECEKSWRSEMAGVWTGRGRW